MIPAADPVLRRDRLLVALSLTGVVALAWVYLVLDVARTGEMPGSMPAHDAMRSPWTTGPLAVTFLMWSIMMVGMMLPSAAPAILLYAGLVRKRRERGGVAPSAWIFTSGYLAVWTAFSLAAALLQAAMEQARLLTPMMASSSTWLTAGLLFTAGAYQFLPVKDGCLQKCRAPLHFFMFGWRPGVTGAFRMGVEHGAFCLGCRWALMLLLFTAGVMNLLWVLLIAGFVLVEKLLPGGRAIGRITGAVLIGAGCLVLFALL